MRLMKAAELVVDYTLYPRNNVDRNHIKVLVDALAAGAELPPIIVDKKSKRVVDGVHRRGANLRYHGDEAEVNVIEKNYRNDAEMFLDALRYNGAHGAKLDSCDRTHCVILGERLGLTIAAISGALNMPVERLGELRTDRTATNSSGLSVALKRTVRHFAGRKLTKRQEAANDSLSGMTQTFYANQLIHLIEAKMLDTSDAALMERLQVLAELLAGVVVVASK